MDARHDKAAAGATAAANRTGLTPLVELLNRIKDTQYRPSLEEMKVLHKINQRIIYSYTAGTFLMALPGVLAYRFWRPQSTFRSLVSALAVSTGLTYGGTLGYALSRDSSIQALLELEGSPLQGELIAILREQDPNHPFLQVLKSKEHSGAVMYDERGQVAYARLPPTPPSLSESGSLHEPSAQEWRPKSPQPSDVGNSGYGEGLKERIRADLERRRQQSGSPSRESAPSEWSGGRGDEESGWRGGGQSVPQGEEGRGSDRGGALPTWQGTRDNDKSFGDGMFSEPLDLAMGGRLDPLQIPEQVPEPHKRLSHMTRQERREYLRSKELATRQKAEGDEKANHSTMSPGLETPSSRPGVRMHNPPPVRLGMADGFGMLGWKI